MDKIIRNDIKNRKDIEYILWAFYREAIENPQIGTFFTEIVQINLEDHIPHITDFWVQQLFYTGSYKKNVLQIHQNLNSKKTMQKIDFDTWMDLFTNVIDQNFKGEKANLMKTRALSIATVIQLKIN